MESVPRRKNGSGTLRQHKSGSWEIRWRGGKKGNGKPHSRYFKTREEAEAALDSIINTLHAGNGSRYKSVRDRKNYRTRTEKVDSVYFLRPAGGGPVKIGRTRNVAVRIREVQASSPVPLEVLCVISNAPQGLEGQLHRRFAEHRLHGEWFKDSAELQECITGLAGTP